MRDLRRRLRRLQDQVGSSQVTWEEAHEAGQRTVARARLKMDRFLTAGSFEAADVDEALLEETEESDEATLEAYRRQEGLQPIHDPREQLEATLDAIADRMQCMERTGE